MYHLTVLYVQFMLYSTTDSREFSPPILTFQMWSPFHSIAQLPVLAKVVVLTTVRSTAKHFSIHTKSSKYCSSGYSDTDTDKRQESNSNSNSTSMNCTSVKCPVPSLRSVTTIPAVLTTRSRPQLSSRLSSNWMPPNTASIQ